MLKTVMLVSAFALTAPAFAQDQKAPGREPMTTAPAQSKPQKAPPAGDAQETTTTQDAPTTAAQGAPIPGAPVSEAAPAEQAAAPAAQTAPATPPVAPAESAAVPADPATPSAPAETAALPATSATPATPASPAMPTETAAVPATPAAPASPTAAVTGATQIAQVVNTEFPTYDKNKDTNLDKVEFGAWMVALKTASDPATKASDPATAKWIDGAFASADADKSKSVSQAELTKYLSQGAE